MKTKIIIKRIALLFLLISIAQSSFCQENYLPGYIIKLPGDTLRGFVDYRNWEKNPNTIHFKEKLGDDKSKYTPMDIKGFSVLDEIYESAIIQTEMSPSNTSELTLNAKQDIEIDTTFLQTMIKGEKSLYFYINKVGKEQFYTKSDTTYNFLIYKKYLKKVNGKYFSTENKRFIGQLSIYFQDCPEIQSKLKNAKYSKKSMEDLFLSYYNQTKSEITFQKKTEGLSFEVGAIVGLSVTYLKFSSNGFDDLVNMDYNESTNFTAGLFFDIVLPRNHKKWSFSNELMYSSYKVSGKSTDYQNENKYTNTNTTLGFSYLKMNNMIRFQYPVKSLFMYANIGISNGFVISETNYRRQESRLYTTYRVEEGKTLDESRKYEQGYIFGVGTKYKRYSLETRFETGNGMSVYPALKSTTSRYSLLLGYRF